ncbi:MAG: dienelactone hydrolase family protein [Opitutales bacterium]
MKLRFALILFLSTFGFLCAENALPELKDSEIPQNAQELWKDIDPRAEPLEPEVLEEWEEDGVILKVMRINVAKVGDKYLKVAGIYGYPKGAKNLPALLQIHGGGQYANAAAVITNAKRGYATFSLAWAGRITSSKYTVRADNIKAFWDNDTQNKNYRITTNWQNIDAYHAPARWGRSSSTISGDEHSLDKVDSPRNSMWFLWTLAGRRALTFLEEQPQVDPDKLGVYGHSMGGKLTVLVAGSDDRLKAAVPSCGGVNTEPSKSELFKVSLDDDNYLKNINIPILFISPANDFNGHIDDTARAIEQVKTKDWRIVSSPHRSHQDEPQGEVASLLFFDNYLKQSFKYPETPKLNFQEFKMFRSNMLFSLDVDKHNAQNIKEVDLYYSFQGDRGDRDLNKQRFWHYAKMNKNKDGKYEVALPDLFKKDKPLWVYANVIYDLKKDYTFAGHYYRLSTANSLVVSTKLMMFDAPDFVKFEDNSSSSVILDSTQENWHKDFYRYDINSWDLMTNKLSDNYYQTSDTLLIEVEAKEATGFVIALDTYAKEITLSASDKVQSIKLKAEDFKDINGDSLKSFKGLNNLKLVSELKIKPSRKDKVKTTMTLGSAKNKNVAPNFKLIKFL